MTKRIKKLEDFYEKNGNYYEINPKNNKEASRKHFKKQCPSCENYFITPKIESLNCSDECRSKYIRMKNIEIFNSGHYIKGTNKSIVEMFTKSGHRFVIDNEDLDSINRLGWTNDKDGYITTKFKLADDEFVHLKLHRFIMKAKNNEIVDHIDGDVTNNSKKNLRIADKSINGLNKKNVKNYYVRGDSFVSRVSYIENNKRKTHTKSFNTSNEAITYSAKFKESLINKKLIYIDHKD